MTTTLTLFNHKGGVGKTTLTVNLADALAREGMTVLLIDTDPQCNLSAFYLPEDDLDQLLGESGDGADENSGDGTIWSAMKPVVEGTGDIQDVELIEVATNTWLAVGDVLLSRYEEELPAAWTESFARKVRGYNVMSALSRFAQKQASKIDADIIIYDVGPNVGALNRTVLLSSDFFATPVHTDLYSLRALATVGQSMSRWIRDWKMVRHLAGEAGQELPEGLPRYLGYVSTAFKVYGSTRAKAHEYWERKLPGRVRTRLVDRFAEVDPLLISRINGKLKVADVKHFASLPARAQEHGVALRRLGEFVKGHDEQIEDAEKQFRLMAAELLKRMGI
jgi:cellulose biosynthesis protein BcsQ